MEPNQTTYSKDFLMLELRQIRGRTVPKTTFYNWLETLAILPGNLHNPRRYTEEERAEIKALCRHYTYGGTTEEFIQEKNNREKGRDQSAA